MISVQFRRTVIYDHFRDIFVGAQTIEQKKESWNCWKIDKHVVYRQYTTTDDQPFDCCCFFVYLSLFFYLHITFSNHCQYTLMTNNSCQTVRTYFYSKCWHIIRLTILAGTICCAAIFRFCFHFHSMHVLYCTIRYGMVWYAKTYYGNQIRFMFQSCVQWNISSFPSTSWHDERHSLKIIPQDISTGITN